MLENDDIRFSAADVLWIHERTGVRCVFAPDVAARFDIDATDAATYAADEARLERGVDADERADVDEGQLIAAE